LLHQDLNLNKRPSSRRWLDRHVHDEYVQRAQRDGYRSRAAYKLLEIQEKDRLLRPGQLVVDLGAAPGGWCQVAVNLVGRSGRVVGLDILPIAPIPGVRLIQGDFRVAEPLVQLHEILEEQPADLVLSDLSPNVTGIAVVDQSRAMHLCELALEFCRDGLKPNGSLVIKVFHGSGFDDYFRELKRTFLRVASRKPKASRAESREVYLVAQGFKTSAV
jgi:23S rRNA (uridine2552-2'-O)-methyltransferase